MNNFNSNIKKQFKQLKSQIESYLKQNISRERFAHTANVAKTAKKYAKKLGLDYYKAELAGWLHDIAKEYPNEKLLEIAKQKNIELDKTDLKNPNLLHARIGEVIANERFSIDDPSILAGIRCHTLAEPNMSKLAMVVYLADATEPSRDKKIRTPIKKTFKEKGLELAVLHTINSKLLMVIKKNKAIHPATIQARNWLLNSIL